MDDLLRSAAQLRRAVQKLAAALPEDDAMEIACVFPAWSPDVPYAQNGYITYGENSVGDPQLYRVAQAHTSRAEWLPDASPALYTPVGLDDDGNTVWAQPAGAHDAYSLNDVVSYNGVLYRSAVDGNTWPPDIFGWEVYDE